MVFQENRRTYTCKAVEFGLFSLDSLVLNVAKHLLDRSVAYSFVMCQQCIILLDSLDCFHSLRGFQLAYAISVGVGYAYGYGRLDFLRMDARFRRWEDTVLANFVQREGWVAGTAATGSDAWNNTGSSGFSMFQRPQRAAASGGLAAPGPATAPPEAAKPAGFPKGGGRTLGGPSKRPPSTEKRAAMLEAAAKRSAAGDDNV